MMVNTVRRDENTEDEDGERSKIVCNFKQSGLPGRPENVTLEQRREDDERPCYAETCRQEHIWHT
jgi:hypothetical protein